MVAQWQTPSGEFNQTSSARACLPMQFSLKSLLIATLAISAMCAVFFALPLVLASVVINVILFVLPAALISGIVYGRGYGRAFCIGGVSACAMLLPLYVSLGIPAMMNTNWSNTTDTRETASFLKVTVAVLCFLTLASGLTAMLVCWTSQTLPQSASPTAEDPTV